jgi:NAD(P)-dependent dehydrogenase (short-subunit alcohol dehydrogenase family)
MDHLEEEMKLQNRVALVTGATRNVGRAVAVGLAREGATVAVNGLTNREGADETVAMIAKEGGKGLTYMGDVSDPAQVEQMVTAIQQDLGPIDILVSNAAIRPRQPQRGLDGITVEYWRKVLSVNLDATFYLTRLVLPGMIEKGSGSIIAVSGLAAFGVRGGAMANASAKAGLLGLMRSVAAGYGSHGIRAHALVLGSMATEDYDHQAYLQGLPSRSLGTGVRSHNLDRIPLGRRGTPEEVATACVFLASDDSSYLTGQAIHLNGGLYMA